MPPPLMSPALIEALPRVRGPAVQDRFALWLLDVYGLRLADRCAMQWLIDDAVAVLAARFNGHDPAREADYPSWDARLHKTPPTPLQVCLANTAWLALSRRPFDTVEHLLIAHRLLRQDYVAIGQRIIDRIDTVCATPDAHPG